MKLALLLLTGIPAAFALSTALNEVPIPDTSHSYNVSECSNALYDGSAIVMCRFWDKAVISWPPEYLRTRHTRVSNPYHARCHNKTIRADLSALVCDYGDVKVIHWSHGPSQSRKEITVNFLSAVMEETPEETTDKLMFETPLKDFTDRREKEDPADLIWESDGCTHAPDNPLGFPFLPACQRHDFGYRNYRAQNRLEEVTKKKIDRQFETDLLGVCEDQHLGLRHACKAAAKLFYEFVKHNPGNPSNINVMARLD